RRADARDPRRRDDLDDGPGRPAKSGAPDPEVHLQGRVGHRSARDERLGQHAPGANYLEVDRLAGVGCLFDRVKEAVQVNGRVERGDAALASAYRLGEQAVHLADVERVATRELGRNGVVALRDIEVRQRVTALSALE